MTATRPHFVKGEIVQILPEYQDPGDGEFTWVVASDESKGRVDIFPSDIGLSIKPLSTVQSSWIERVPSKLD